MSQKNAILVLGYNNTRVNDVKTIKHEAAKLLNAVTVLCKKDPVAEDFLAADYVINVGLAGTTSDVADVRQELKKQLLNPVALLPFSDQGTQLGASLAKEFGLIGPDVNLIHGALDKYTFRQLENAANNAPIGYKKIKSQMVESLDQLKQIYSKLDGNVFLKPAKEGNSRGCINLKIEKNLEVAWNQVEAYVTSGIVAEELILNGIEYSWDHVAGASWITEKKTTQDEYRAEYQQIVPAPISEIKAQTLTNAGKFMASLVGSNNGACHNEIFIFNDGSGVAGVEPNLRPAGSRVWDLASLAFDNFNSWEEWILWACGKKVYSNTKLKRNFFAGVRFLKSPKNGILNKVSDLPADQLALNNNVELIDLVWTKAVGAKVSGTARDNADYIGYIILKSSNYDDLSTSLDAVSTQLESSVLVV